MRPAPPCVPDCEDRAASCHGKCQRYLDWRKEYEEFKRKEREFDEWIRPQYHSKKR